MTTRALTELVGTSNIPAPRSRWIVRLALPLVLVVGMAIVLGLAAWRAWGPVPTVETVSAMVRDVEVETVVRAARTGAPVVQAPGWIEADPSNVYVSALVQGVVAEVLVLEGERVTAGQPVARLVDDEARIALRRTEAEAAAAAASVDSADAALAAARTVRETLVERERAVAVARAEVTRFEADLEATLARIAAGEANAAATADELERTRGLVTDGAAAEGPLARLAFRLDAERAEVRALRAGAVSLRSRLEATRAVARAAKRDQELLVAETLAVASAEAALARARADADRAFAMRDDAALQLERHTVRAPSDGVVIERIALPGASIRFGEHAAHIVHLYDPAHLQVRADIPLADAAKVGAGQSAEVVVDLLPDVVIRGIVTRFLHRADIQKNTVEAKVRLIDPPSLLRPDMLARVRIFGPDDTAAAPTRQTERRVFAPRSAVRDGPPATIPVVESIDAGRGVVAERSVTLGSHEVEGWVEITDGLRPGERIVLGPDLLTTGRRVRLARKEEMP